MDTSSVRPNLALPSEVIEFAKRKGLGRIYYTSRFSTMLEKLSMEKPIVVYGPKWLLLIRKGVFERYKIVRVLGELKFVPWNDLTMLNFSDKIDINNPETEKELRRIYESWCGRENFWEFTSILINHDGDPTIRDIMEQAAKRFLNSNPNIGSPKELQIREFYFRFGDYSGTYLTTTYFVENYSISWCFETHIGGTALELAEKYKLLFAVIHGHKGIDLASPGDMNVAVYYRGMRVIAANC